MSKKPSNIEQLKNFAFEIPKEGLIVRKKGKMNAIYNSVTIERVLSMDKCYCIQNGYVTFITNSQEYLIPYFVGIAEILRKEGFTEIFLVHALKKEIILLTVIRQKDGRKFVQLLTKSI